MPNWVCNEFNTLRLVEATFWNRLVWLINMYSNYSRCFSWTCLQIIHLVSVLPITNWQIASLMEAQMVSDIVVALFCCCPRPSCIPIFPINWKNKPFTSSVLLLCIFHTNHSVGAGPLLKIYDMVSILWTDQTPQGVGAEMLCCLQTPWQPTWFICLKAPH